MSELLPCPFCGGRAEMNNDTGPNDGYFVEWTECTNCGSRTGGSRNESPEAWNRRTATPSEVATKEADDCEAMFAAYRTWPEDIRKKLSVHDLRRMAGWHPMRHAVDAEPPSVDELPGMWDRSDTLGGATDTRTCGAILMLEAAQDWISERPHGDNCYLDPDHMLGKDCHCGKDAILSAIGDCLIDPAGE